MKSLGQDAGLLPIALDAEGVLRVEDSVTPMPGLVVPFVSFTIVYILLALAVIVLMRRQVRLATPEPVELTGKDDGDAD